jgi:hypothetical protein
MPPTAPPAKAPPPCLTAALEYAARGWPALCLCPPDHAGMPGWHQEKCSSPGKCPCGRYFTTWKRWQTEIPSANVLKLAWGEHPTANVGVATGPLSFLGLDVEGGGGEKYLAERCAAEPVVTPEFTTGHGRRLLLAWPEGLDLPNDQYTFGPGDELRVLCLGRQTAMPPSAHWTGAVYEWVAGRSPADVPLAPCPAWLLQALREKAEGKRTAPDRPTALPVKVTGATPDSVTRGIAYMARYPSGQEGRDASGNAFALACRLVRGFLIDPDTAVRLMLHSDWNAGCRNKQGGAWPWTEKELRHKVEGAQQAPDKEVEGYLLNAPRKDRPAPAANGQAHAAPPAEAQPPPAQVAKGKNGRARRAPVFIDGADLVATEFPPQRWAVTGVIPEGVTLLAGRPKVGKSWWLLDAALAVAAGGVAFGSVPVEKGSVLYLALEDGGRRLNDRIRKLLKAQGDAAMPRGVTFATAGNFPRVNEGGLDCLAEWLEAHADARLVIVDTLAKLRAETSGRRNAYDEDYEALGAIQSLAIGRGVAVLAATHTRKPKAGGDGAEDLLDETQGSTGLTGAADAVLVLRRPRQQQEGKLFITGRDVEEREVRMHLDPQYHLWRILEGNSNDPDHGLSSEERRVRAELRKLGRGATPADVAPLIRKSSSATRSLLSRMYRDGHLNRDEATSTYSVPSCHTMPHCHTDVKPELQSD